jgi:Tfp pilus assembly protein PilN
MIGSTRNNSGAATFLPDDYVREARERRSGFFALALFAIVMGSVFAAFLVTNRQWTSVRTAQANINGETEKAAKEIAEMKRLESMRAQMVEKAELARGLLEPVPRSVLLASLVNTMPADLSLIELEVKSEEIKSQKAAAPQGADPKARRMTKGKEPEAPAKPEPVRRRVVVNATGVAPDDLDVSGWMGALSKVPFLSGIRLEVSEEKEFGSTMMRQFRISMRIEPGADVRDWDGLKDLARSREEMPRDPMADGDVGAGARILPGPTKVAGESDEGAANEEGNR